MRVLVEPHRQPRDPLINLALLLGLLIIVIPRLLFPSQPQPLQLRPMVAEFGLVALRISIVHHILYQKYDVVSLAYHEQLSPACILITVEPMLDCGAEIRTQNLSHDGISIYLIVYGYLC